ncbi:MAG: GNAT family N-acetyltransferase [Gammaproteobacteria bacterium CG22_combo_CG10-13_8_21_14_all_40_8]|nr:MAG: GNAT family N-acetyltransferase [Gammaproteobacteria bacterium CG22_combo_CG10-13_8_21_14_all_40_8]
MQITHRIASSADIPQIIELMQASIECNMKSFLTTAEINAAKQSMGLDRTLLEDQTYFVIETIKAGKTIMIGCGGWGKRKTLYGGDHTKGRDDSFSDPSTDAARIRAMYTHPDWTRLGIGSKLLQLGEQAARAHGFKRIELGSTLPGEPLYLKMGFKEISRDIQISDNGSKNVIIKMSKDL